MATSAYSNINESSDVGGFESIDYVGQVQQGLQGRYDMNKAKVQQIMDDYHINFARESDQKEFQGKMSELVSMVNNSKGINFLDSNLDSDIRGHIAQAFDQDTIKQIRNTNNIISYNKTIAQKAQEGKGAYNEANDYFARKQAGYNEYMSGNTNDLGQLNYTDYINTNEVLTTKLQKWAKDFGIQSDVITEGSMASDFLSITKVKSLDGDRIRQFLATEIQNSPELQRQMMIDSDYKYRGLDDATLKTQRDFDLNKQIVDNKTNIDLMREQQKRYNKDSPEYAQYEQALSVRQDNANRLKDRAEMTFNRESYTYEIGANNMMDGLVASYSKRDVTDVKYSDMPFRIRDAKNRYQLAVDKFSYQQSRDALKDAKEKEEENLLVFESGVGRDQELSQSVQLTVENELQDFTLQGLNILKSKPEYSNKSPEELEKILVGMVNGVNTKDFGTQGDANLNRVLNNMSPILKKLGEHKKNLYDSYNETVMGPSYEGIRKGQGINLDNLAIESPLLAKSLKEGKSWMELSDSNRDAIMAETLIQMREREVDGTSSNLSGGNNSYNKLIEYLQDSNPNLNISEIEKRTSEGLLKSYGRTALATAGLVGQAGLSFLQGFTGANIASTLGYGEQAERMRTSATKGLARSATNLIQRQEAASRAEDRVFSSDSNVRAINSWQTEGGLDIKALNKNWETQATNALESDLGAFSDKTALRMKNNVIVDPKANKALFNEVSQLAQGIAKVRIDPNIPVTIQDAGENYSITVVPQASYAGLKPGEAWSSMAPILIPKTSTNKLQNIFVKGETRANAVDNPYGSITNTKIGFSFPNNEQERQQALFNLYNTDSNLYDRNSLQSMAKNTLLTKQEMRDKYKYMDSTKQEAIQNAIDAKYYTRPVPRIDGGVGVSIHTIDGQGRDVYLETFDYPGKFDPITFESVTPEYIQAYLNNYILRL